MYEVTMPKLSDSMEEGKIIAWKVKEGDAVREGDVIAEIESDKAVMELESFRDGVVRSITRGDGAEVRVGEVIALIAPAAGETEGAKPEKARRKAEARKGKPVRAAAGAAHGGEPPTAAPPPVPPVQAPGARVAASPYARKLAAERGIELASVAGTGPGGRVTAADVDRAGGAAPAVARPARPMPAVRPDEELPPIEAAPGEAVVEEASFRLRTQALRVTNSKHVIPHFYLTRGADVTALVRRREELKQKFGATITHVVTLACVRAIAAHPEVNRSYDRGRVIKWNGVNLGLAVATDEGLTVAVLRGAERLSFGEIVARSNELFERARVGHLTADERRHAAFTITNLGMFNVEHFEPIINPPSSITLGVATARAEPVVRDGAIHVGHVMRLTASCDHRIVDGATAARFMGTLAGLLEQPDALVEA